MSSGVNRQLAPLGLRSLRGPAVNICKMNCLCEGLFIDDDMMPVSCVDLELTSKKIAGTLGAAASQYNFSRNSFEHYVKRYCDSVQESEIFWTPNLEQCRQRQRATEIISNRIMSG